MAQRCDWSLAKDEAVSLPSLPPPPVSSPPPPLSSSSPDLCMESDKAPSSASPALSCSSSLMHQGEGAALDTDYGVRKGGGKRLREERATDTLSSAGKGEAEAIPLPSPSSSRMLEEEKKIEGEEVEEQTSTEKHSSPSISLETEKQAEKDEEKEVVRSFERVRLSVNLPDVVSPSTLPRSAPSTSSSSPTSRTSSILSSSTGKTSYSRREEEEDLTFAILGDHELETLTHHKGIRSALRDSRLQSMIRSIDRSNCKLDALRLALRNDPCFKEFYDTTLSVIRQAQMERANRKYVFSRTS